LGRDEVLGDAKDLHSAGDEGGLGEIAVAVVGGGPLSKVTRQ
jgi:hypothetical protein